jgi:farnesol dehydrogenase
MVTGATGFIGGYLIRQLVERGKSVRAFVRRPEAIDPQVKTGIEVLKGDIRDRDAVSEAVRGADTVMHLAAFARAWSPNPSEFYDANVWAVEGLLEAAARHGLRRLVHVSTALTCPLASPSGAGGRIRTRALTPYERTKLEGERLVEAFAREHSQAVIVHPTRVYGPGPLTDANGVTKTVALYLRGAFRFRIADGDVRANYVHVADVATGIRLAAENGRNGAHYVLGSDTNLSFREFLARVAEISGVHRRVLALPPAAALAIGHLGQLWGRMSGATSLTPGWIRVFLEDIPFDISATRREIGYEPRDLTAGLRETIDWLAKRDGGAT